MPPGSIQHGRFPGGCFQFRCSFSGGCEIYTCQCFLEHMNKIIKLEHFAFCPSTSCRHPPGNIHQDIILLNQVSWDDMVSRSSTTPNSPEDRSQNLAKLCTF